jgi:hypothetical protein
VSIADKQSPVPSDVLMTVPDVIKALGGTTAVGDLLGITSQAVSNCIRKKVFPPAHFVKMRNALSERGYSAPLALWKQEL